MSELRTIKPRAREGLAALAAFGLILGLAVGGAWPFNGRPTTESQVASPSVMQFLMGDRITLGVVRLLLLALSTFAILSLAAFLVRGRWLKGLSSKGWDVDERQETFESIDELKAQIRELTWERDEALRGWAESIEEGQETIEKAGGGMDNPAYNDGDDTPEGPH
jgi:hypothetical protein